MWLLPIDELDLVNNQQLFFVKAWFPLIMLGQNAYFLPKKLVPWTGDTCSPRVTHTVNPVHGGPLSLKQDGSDVSACFFESEIIDS